MLTQAILVYTIASCFTEAVIYYLSYKILDRKVVWPRLIIMSVAAAFMVCPVLYLVSYGLIFPNANPRLVIFLGDALIVIVNVITVYFVVERNFRRVIIVAPFAYFIYNQLFLTTMLFLPQDYTMGSLENQSISVVVLIICTCFVGKLIEKVETPFFIDYCTKTKKRTAWAVFTGVLLARANRYFVLFHETEMDTNTLLSMTGLVLLFFFVLLFRFISNGIIHEENEKAQKNIIAQQEAYIQNLEEIQKDVRLYRHDFTNMMSGMYLDVKEGKTEALERYMQNMLNEFDKNIGSKIQTANQIMNLEIIELKGLLMTKMSQMISSGIPCRIEVLYLVRECAMKTQDLLRCVGILADNAMEAAKNAQGGVDIVIMAQNNSVDILITNPVDAEPDINKIWKKGYSTKGDGRGLGLYSYREIVGQYPQASCSAFCRGGRFCQELRIEG